VSEHGTTAARAAANTVRLRLGIESPAAAIILGSGLGSLVEKIENAKRINYSEIPGFHATKVVGHAGQLIDGTLNGREVPALSGAFHMFVG